MKYAKVIGVVLTISLVAVVGCKPASNASPLPPVWVSDLSAADVTRPADGLTVVKLDNGMRVIVKETHNAPIVDVRCYVMTGGMYEGKWLGAGLSHLCEHLCAEGAEHTNGPAAKPGAPQLSRTDRIGKIGGQSNAFTSQDITNYYIEAAAGKTMNCIDLVAEWMAKPNITKESFEREHGIVQRELEMGLNQPTRVFYYAIMANLYPNHPAGVPVIGYKPPLAALTYEDVIAYHSQTYVPQNMVFLVIGDVNTAAVLSRIRKDFADFRPARVPSHTLPEVQPTAGIRRVLVPQPRVKEDMESLAFQTIPLAHEDLYALDLLSTVLGEGNSSRLVQRIRDEQKLVTSISSGSSTPHWGKGYFEVDFNCRPGQADKAEQAVLAQLREIADNGPSEQELARAKRQKTAELINSQQTLESQAETLASDLMNTGDINFSIRYVQRIQAVTAQQVQAAARKYFRFSDMVVTRMTPAEAASAAAGQVQKLQAARKPQTFTLPNGLRVVLKPLPSTTGKLGLVSMVLATKGGLMLETDKTNGMGNLMAALSVKGAGNYSAKDIAAFFDQAGGSIGGSCGNNSIYWQATVLNDSFDKALDIFANVVERPTMADSELDIVRRGVLADIDRIDTQPGSELMRFFRTKFFNNSPYRMLPVGTPAVVNAANGKTLREYHDKNIKAGASVLAIYGDFDAAAARAAVEKLFAGLPKGDVTLNIPPARVIPAKGELYTRKTLAETALVLVAAPGMTIFDRQDKYHMDVLKTIISGWELPSGWLHDELRGKQLVYSVYAFSWMGVAPGAFVTVAQCQPEKTNEVAGIVLKNLNKAAAYTPTQSEIDLAVNTILTAELLNDQSIGGLATAGALDELWGFGYDHRSKLESIYRGVKPEDVARVGKKYLGKGYAVVVTTPEPEKIVKPVPAK